MRADAAVLAVNSATAGIPASATRSSVASSHMVITEPVPDVIEEIGWTGGENIHDCRTLLHYLRTTEDGRIALGWGGGRMGFGGRHRDRLDIDPSAARHAPQRSAGCFPQLAGREVTHAWGGPIDVSPTHLPIFGSRGRCTTASASPATASARRISAARSSRASRSTAATRSRGSRSSTPTASSSRPSRCAGLGGTHDPRARSSGATTPTTAATPRSPHRVRLLAAAAARAPAAALARRPRRRSRRARPRASHSRRPAPVPAAQRPSR